MARVADLTPSDLDGDAKAVYERKTRVSWHPRERQPTHQRCIRQQKRHQSMDSDDEEVLRRHLEVLPEGSKGHGALSARSVLIIVEHALLAVVDEVVVLDLGSVADGEEACLQLAGRGFGARTKFRSPRQARTPKST